MVTHQYLTAVTVVKYLVCRIPGSLVYPTIFGVAKQFLSNLRWMLVIALRAHPLASSVTSIETLGNHGKTSRPVAIVRRSSMNYGNK